MTKSTTEKKQHFSYQLYACTSLTESRQMTVWAAPRWGTICISTLQMTNAGAEEAVFRGYRKSVSWTCPKFSVALLQLSIWNILKIEPFGPWTTHLPLAMADSATGLAQDRHKTSMFTELLSHSNSACSQCFCQIRWEAEQLCFTWGFTADPEMTIHSWYNAWRISNSSLATTDCYF